MLRHTHAHVTPSLMSITHINNPCRYFAEATRLGVTHTAVSWHSYNYPAELDREAVEAVRGVMAAHGLPPNLPILNTEVCCWASCGDHNGT